MSSRLGYHAQPEPMAKRNHTADEFQAISLQGLLTLRGLTHLRVRRHGVLLIVESGPDADAVPHVRFRRHGAHIWSLEIATHTGAWEVVPMRGQAVVDLVNLVQADFPWTLAPI